MRADEEMGAVARCQWVTVLVLVAASSTAWQCVALRLWALAPCALPVRAGDRELRLAKNDQILDSAPCR